jgi:hypothetical protein
LPLCRFQWHLVFVCHVYITFTATHQCHPFSPDLVVLDIVVTDKRHPNQRDGSQGEREVLRETKSHGLEDEELTGKMSQGDNVCPVSNGVNRTNVEVISCVASNNASNKCPGAEKSSGKGSKLIGSLGVVLSRNQLVDLILWLELVGLGRELGVANEFAVVDSSGKV